MSARRKPEQRVGGRGRRRETRAWVPGGGRTHEGPEGPSGPTGGAAGSPGGVARPRGACPSEWAGPAAVTPSSGVRAFPGLRRPCPGASPRGPGRVWSGAGVARRDGLAGGRREWRPPGTERVKADGLGRRASPCPGALSRLDAPSEAPGTRRAGSCSSLMLTTQSPARLGHPEGPRLVAPVTPA